MAQTLVQLMGPWASLSMRAMEGMQAINGGDFYKGTELMMPKGISDTMKAYRYASEGMTNKGGDTLLKPDDISFGAEIGQAMGLPTTSITERSWRANEAYQVNQFYSDKTNELKTRYAKAAKAGDSEGMQDAREEWMRVQAARQDDGLKRQPLSVLLKAPQEMRKRERGVAGGVEFSKGNRGLGRQLSSLTE